MTQFVHTIVRNQIGIITLDRPKALNSLSLDMVRVLTQCLLNWRDDDQIRAVLIHSSSDKAFCAGGDIRFFYEAGKSTPLEGSALLEDFFTEEYALNHLIHFYPKPYIALMDGIVMGGGMGIAQGGTQHRIRIVTERTKMAMPEVNIGLFPDVGGGYFLSRAPGQLGTYLGVTGEIIGGADALYADLADLWVPSSSLPGLIDLLTAAPCDDIQETIRNFAAPFQSQANPSASRLAARRASIDRHFGYDSVAQIQASLLADDTDFAQQTLGVMRKRSPLMMCVTLLQLRRGATMNVAECLRMERNMVRRCFEYGEVLEGIRAVVIDKDNTPCWNPSSLDAVSPELVARFFDSPWPAHAHPLRHLA